MSNNVKIINTKKEKTDWWIALTSSLFSGLLAILVTFFLTTQYEKDRRINEYKLSIVKGVIAYKHILGHPNTPGSENFISNFNQIPIAFNDSPKVIKALNNFLEIRSNDNFSTEKNNEAFISLVKEMLSNAGIDAENLDERHIMTVIYVPNSLE